MKLVNLTKLASWAAAALLTGCGFALPITQQVDVPVYVPCVKATPARPEFELDKLSLDAADGEKVLALTRNWPRGRRYEEMLEAVVAGCL